MKLGQPFEVVCTTYDWYEWCTFKHSENSCEIEWQYDLWNVTMGPCDDYRDRVEFRVSDTATIVVVLLALILILSLSLSLSLSVNISVPGCLQQLRVWSPVLRGEGRGWGGLVLRLRVVHQGWQQGGRILCL